MIGENFNLTSAICLRAFPRSPLTPPSTTRTRAHTLIEGEEGARVTTRHAISLSLSLLSS